MSTPNWHTEQISDSLSLSFCDKTFVDSKGQTRPAGNYGYWLHDEAFGMNLAIREKTKEAALTEALLFYHKKYAELKRQHETLSAKVDGFLAQFADPDEDFD